MFPSSPQADAATRRATAEEALEHLTQLDAGGLAEADLADHLPALYRLKAMLEATIVDAADTFDGRKQWALDGAFSASGWIAARTGTTRASASSTVKVARQARHMTHAMDEARAGRVSADQLRILAAARGVSDTTAKEFDDDETRLVDQVTGHHVESAARLMRAWVAAADPDADDDSHAEREQKRKVNLSTSLDGMGFLDGLLTGEANAVLRAQLEAITDDLHRRGLSTGADGTRLTAAQLRHDALVEMARRAGASATAVDIRRDAKARAEEAATNRGAASPTAATPPAGPDATDPGPTRDHGGHSEAADRPAPGAPAHGADPPVPDAEASPVGGDAEHDVSTTAHPAAAAARGAPTPSSEPTATGTTTAGGAHPDRDDEDAGPGNRPDPGRGPTMIGPDDLDDAPWHHGNSGSDGPCPGERGACSTQHGAQGLLLPPGTGPPGSTGPPGTDAPDDKVAGGLGRPLFVALIDLDTLERRPPRDLLARRAEIVGVGPLSASAIERYLCDAGVSRVVTRGASLPLDVGAVSRTATPAQWRALIAHSEHCEFPGCSAPWEWCEAHHLDHWTRTHTTALDGLALGCNGHHHLLHRPGWSMARRADLSTVVTRPDGTTLVDPRG